MLYRELRPAMKHLQKVWDEKHYLLSRPYFFQFGSLQESAQATFFYPGTELTSERLTHSLGRIFESFAKITVETKVSREKIVTLEEKIEEVVRRLQGGEAMRFRILSGESASEMILSFLAILHLARDGRIHAIQGEHFSDIIVSTRDDYDA
jgi:chromatin segregation and condensation protein Rec8/ScpA/Scc1 (kleisin family)